jgi:hypothetical protein
VETFSARLIQLVHRGKIGLLPDGLWHIGIKVSSTDLCTNINH